MIQNQLLCLTKFPQVFEREGDASLATWPNTFVHTGHVGSLGWCASLRGGSPIHFHHEKRAIGDAATRCKGLYAWWHEAFLPIFEEEEKHEFGLPLTGDLAAWNPCLTGCILCRVETILWCEFKHWPVEVVKQDCFSSAPDAPFRISISQQ